MELFSAFLDLNVARTYLNYLRCYLQSRSAIANLMCRGEFNVCAEALMLPSSLFWEGLSVSKLSEGFSLNNGGVQALSSREMLPAQQSFGPLYSQRSIIIHQGLAKRDQMGFSEQGTRPLI